MNSLLSALLAIVIAFSLSGCTKDQLGDHFNQTKGSVSTEQSEEQVSSQTKTRQEEIDETRLALRDPGNLNRGHFSHGQCDSTSDALCCFLYVLSSGETSTTEPLVKGVDGGPDTAKGATVSGQWMPTLDFGSTETFPIFYDPALVLDVSEYSPKVDSRFYGNARSFSLQTDVDNSNYGKAEIRNYPIYVDIDDLTVSIKVHTFSLTERLEMIGQASDLFDKASYYDEYLTFRLFFDSSDYNFKLKYEGTSLYKFSGGDEFLCNDPIIVSKDGETTEYQGKYDTMMPEVNSVIFEKSWSNGMKFRKDE